MNLTTFSFNQVNVRTVIGENGEPWFVAVDVCKVLEIGNVSQAMTRLDADEKTLITNDGQDFQAAPTMTIINESGLYSLILTSRKPEAKAFVG